MKEGREKKFDQCKGIKKGKKTWLRYSGNDCFFISKVTFVGEGALVYGGARREIFRLLTDEMQNSSYFQGSPTSFFFKSYSGIAGNCNLNKLMQNNLAGSNCCLF